MKFSSRKKKSEETQIEMATANSCSETKKTEDMSVEEVCNWIKTNFDDTVAAKFAGRKNSIEFDYKNGAESRPLPEMHVIYFRTFLI